MMSIDTIGHWCAAGLFSVGALASIGRAIPSSTLSLSIGALLYSLIAIQYSVLSEYHDGVNIVPVLAMIPIQVSELLSTTMADDRQQFVIRIGAITSLGLLYASLSISNLWMYCSLQVAAMIILANTLVALRLYTRSRAYSAIVSAISVSIVLAPSYPLLYMTIPGLLAVSAGIADRVCGRQTRSSIHKKKRISFSSEDYAMANSIPPEVIPTQRRGSTSYFAHKRAFQPMGSRDSELGLSELDNEEKVVVVTPPPETVLKVPVVVKEDTEAKPADVKALDQPGSPAKKGANKGEVRQKSTTQLHKPIPMTIAFESGSS